MADVLDFILARVENLIKVRGRHAQDLISGFPKTVEVKIS